MDYEYFMGKALDQAKKALSEGEFPVGCVIVCQNKIVVTGARKGTRGDFPDEIDHAEIIALKHLSNLNLNLSENKITLVTTLEPCLMCFGASMLSNVNEIVYAYEDVMGGGMDCDVSKLTSLYKHRQITVVSNVLRKESLKLFKAFFQNPSNIYWKGSLLAEYTLKQ
jgi:tRNA(adenine34) deaminase